MGNFTIRIQGVGTHHNQLPSDVEQMAAKFVDELRAKGHSITAADVHTGGVTGLHPESQVMPLKPVEQQTSPAVDDPVARPPAA